MAIYFVTTNQERRDGKKGFHAFPWECPVDDLNTLMELLETKNVMGFQLVYRELPDKRRLITERRPKGMSRTGFQTIEIPRWQFVERAPA